MKIAIAVSLLIAGVVLLPFVLLVLKILWIAWVYAMNDVFGVKL